MKQVVRGQANNHGAAKHKGEPTIVKEEENQANFTRARNRGRPRNHGWKESISTLRSF